MHVAWTEELNTGIDEIDASNRKLVDFIKTLQAAQESGDRDKVGAVLEELLEHAVNHFLFEEHLMQEAGYEYLATHEKIHEVFAKRLAEFRGRYAKGEDVSADLIAMLDNWLEIHVKEEDQRYAESVQQVIEEEGGKTWVSGIMKKLFG